ncbi:MAG: hypothetical protein E6Q97_33910 [Desulfurellales bacterium]|nr:MAG: hypothetical protein E6Q97_33910 [Desulfurellales bacterium]
MLRVNLLEDPTFRKDLLDMARGLLRGIAESIIAETIAREGWLQQRLDSYLAKNPIEGLVATALRKGDYWNPPPVQAAIDKRVDDRIRRHLDLDHKLSEQDLRRLIREEIKKCFQP